MGVLPHARVDGFVRVAVKVVVAFLTRLPRPVVPPFGQFLARLARFLARKDRFQLRANVHAVYGLPPATTFGRLFERQVFEHQCVCALETLHGLARPETLTLTGFEALASLGAAAAAAGRGHILVTAHLGAWELCALYGKRAVPGRFLVLAKPPRYESVRDELADLRRQAGVEVLWTDRKSLLRDMLTALRENDAVGFVMDQKPEGRRGPVVSFLGRPTEFVSGPAAMALRTGCCVTAFFCVREGPFQYRMLSTAIVGPNQTTTETECALTARMAAAIEDAIRLYPEQWTWNYKRWRNQGPSAILAHSTLQ